MFNNSILYGMIGKDERILWKGKPNFRCFILESIFNPLLPFALIWGLIDFSIIGAFIWGFPSSEQSGFGGYVIIPFLLFFFIHLMPVWIYLAGVGFSFRKYRYTEFIVTDKGVYTSGGIFSQTYEHKPFAELSHVNIHRGIIDQIIGVGDVVLTSNQDGYNTREAHSLFRGITICDISNYTQVYQLVKKLQTDIYSDTMYPNDLRPKENHGYNTQYKGFDE